MTTADAGSGVIRLPFDGPPLVTAHPEDPGAFRDHVPETNAGDQVWFVADEAELATRLGVNA